MGGVTNSGTITATGGQSGIGIAVSGTTPIMGGITNTGTITGSTAAISLRGESGVTNTELTLVLEPSLNFAEVAHPPARAIKPMPRAVIIGSLRPPARA